MALTLRSSSFVNPKDTKTHKTPDDFTGSISYMQFRPACGLRARNSRHETQVSHENESLLSNQRDFEGERLHALSGGLKIGSSVPVFVMLPLDTVSIWGSLNKPRALNASLMALKSAGVEGVMVDAWWGLVEKDGPLKYNWEGYVELVNMVEKHGLKVQVVMSFHQCGGNVGDSCRYGGNDFFILFTLMISCLKLTSFY